MAKEGFTGPSRRDGGCRPLRSGLLLLIWASAATAADAPHQDGLRRLQGRYVTLVTDLPAEAKLDELPQVFDQAVRQWAEYFHVAIPRAAAWHVQGCLIRSRPRFRQAGLLPDDLPPFLHGYQRGTDFWVLEQPSDYFLRHLMLHEGTHAFMQTALGGSGPPWYMEGMAELLATHRWADGQLTLKTFPARREDVPFWGRIRVVRQAAAQGQALSLGEILHLPPDKFRQVEPYAWAWAAATFLDGHPRWKARFRQLPKAVREPGDQFTDRFWRELQESPQELQEAWQLFVHHLDYGYVTAEDQVTYRRTQSWTPGTRLEIAADRGWQSTGWQLEAGRRYVIRAEGRYQIADQPGIWWCQPDGVTLEYHARLPLGMLLAAVRGPLTSEATSTALLQPQPVGSHGVLQPSQTGILFLQVNEPAGRRGDNRGQLTVWIERVDSVSPD